MTTPDNPFAGLSPNTPGYVAGNRAVATRAELSDSWNRFNRNALAIQDVPQLVGLIGQNALFLARELQSPHGGDGAVPTDAVHQTHGDNHHSRHHVENLKPGRLRKRGEKHTKSGNQAGFNRQVYDDAVAHGAPEGWTVGLGDPLSPVAEFTMLGTDGKLYDVDSFNSGGTPKTYVPKDGGPGKIYQFLKPNALVPMVEAPGNQVSVAIGPKGQEGLKTKKGTDATSPLWQYFPSTKVASAILGIPKPTTTKEYEFIQQFGDQYLAPQLGADWKNVADIEQLLQGYVLGVMPNASPDQQQRLHNNMREKMRALGVLDTVPKELAHLKALSTGLGALATGSGKFRETELPPEVYPTRQEQEQAKLRMAESLIPELDVLDVAIQNASRDPQAERDYAQNMQRKKEIEKTLKQLGAYDVPAEAGVTIFDPRYHEAIAMAPGSLPNNTPLTTERLSKVRRAGYMMNGRVIRPALVEVSREHLAPQPADIPAHPHGFTGNVTSF